MSDVKISIIMPVYNDEEFIRDSLDSALSQTLEDIEIICIDDGSTDSSLEILKEYHSKFGDKIKIFNQENQGSGIARNNAMKYAKGEYIAFLDSDDIYMDSNALQMMYASAIKNNSDMVSANLKVLTPNGELIINNNLERFTEEKILMPIDYGIPYSFYKNIFKRSFIIDNGFKFPDLLRGQDPVFFAEILVKLTNFSSVPVEFYALRTTGNNFGKINNYRKKYDYIYHFKLVFDILRNAKFYSLVNKYKDQLFYYFRSPENSEEDKQEIKKIVNNVFKDDELILNACNSIFNDIKVSVVVPVYNVEKYLDESLASILNQTLKDIEVVCVNDGSKDNSLEILQRFADKDSRVKVIDKENGGCGSARNKALDNANGDYIYFFDPDDYVVPNALEVLYNNAISNNSDFVIFKIARFRDGQPIDYSVPGFEFEKVFGNKDFSNFTFDYRSVKRHVLLSSFAPWTKFYKKEFLDKYGDFRFHTNVAFDDVPFHIQSMVRASKISYVPEFLYHYRLSNPTSVNNTASNAPDIFRIVDYVEDFLRNEGVFDEFRDDFYIFKVTQFSLYISSSHSEKYFADVKNKVNEVNFKNTDSYQNAIKHQDALKRNEAIINANSISDYENNLRNMDVNYVVSNKTKSFQTEINKLNNTLNESKNEIESLTVLVDMLKKRVLSLSDNPNEEFFMKEDFSIGEIKNLSFNEDLLGSPKENNYDYKLQILKDKNKYLNMKNKKEKNNSFVKNIFSR